MGTGPWEDAIPPPDERLQEVLSDQECRHLLQHGSVGRLAYTDGALPAILPLSYQLHDGQVVVSAARGSALPAALHRTVVAFGVDSWDVGHRSGWWVNVVGPSRLVTRPEEVRRLDALDELEGSDPRPSSDRCWIAIHAELVHGRRTTAPKEECSGDA